MLFHILLMALIQLIHLVGKEPTEHVQTEPTFEETMEFIKANSLNASSILLFYGEYEAHTKITEVTWNNEHLIIQVTFERTQNFDDELKNVNGEYASLWNI